MLAARDVDILAAGVDANNAVLACGGISLRPAVPLNAQQLEIHLANLSARIFEGQRKITVDTMPDLAPFRLDSYGLGDGQFAILGNADG